MYQGLAKKSVLGQRGDFNMQVEQLSHLLSMNNLLMYCKMYDNAEKRFSIGKLSKSFSSFVSPWDNNSNNFICTLHKNTGKNNDKLTRI